MLPRRAPRRTLTRNMLRRAIVLFLAFALVLACGCTAIAPSRGGGQTKPMQGRRVNPADVALLPGYRIDVVATGLNMPTGVAFDDQNRAYVTEAGYSYGE